MNKVYLVAAKMLEDALSIKAPIIVCESKTDAEALLDMWDEDYTIIEVPYLAAEAPAYFPYAGTPKTNDVEPMPFINKLATVNKGIEHV